MCLGKVSVSDLVQCLGEDHKARELETVLRIQIGNKSNFENQSKSLFSKASQKLGTLQRMCNLLNT